MKNNMKKFLSLLLAVLMMASMSVTAFADEPKDFEGDSMSGGNDFNYVVVTKDVYTDISGVKLTWSVPVVKYTKTDTRTWNTETLHWEQTNPTSTEGTAVSFTLTNRGSYAVIASASFALEDSLKKTGEETADAASVSFDTNDVTLESIVNATTKAKKNAGAETSDADYLTQNCSATIKGTVSIGNADKLSNGSGKLGTYTVSIRNTVHTVTVTYYKTAEQLTAQEPITETVTVNDGAEITINDHTITIGEYSFTAVSSSVMWCYEIDEDAEALESGDTVTADMTILGAV